ncbi:uncharacterized protein LOC130647772 [Hydractinia symbiolongicarpus]|uniref:uncharacterized protein LOC130647772 n=1 Tax=Hydractinia symbiolongicarpus TaxID=13093 RepID=UPI0025514AA1|nr:uncharacterized protein LOC130647772 [Hydractinia symbiolongicarpus]
MAQKGCEPEREILHRYSEPWEKSDFILKVESEKLHVHKTVLELASPVISNILQSTRTSDELLITNKKVKVVVLMLDLIYPAGPFIEDITCYKELLDLSKEYEIVKIRETVDRLLAQIMLIEQTKYNNKSYFSSLRFKSEEIKSMVLAIEYLKAAEQHCLLKTKERCCSLLIHCCYGEPFESREYRSLSPAIQLSILKAKLQPLKVNNNSIKSIIKF